MHVGGGVKGPPEALVFGAKLRCTRSLTPSFLFVPTDFMDINNLPKACVIDREPEVNIPLFGTCHCGMFATNPCMMQLPPEWTNPEAQSESINGYAIITTHSFIVCDMFSGMITPIDSGQSGEIASELMFLLDIEEQYPGLLDALMNPYGSIYIPVDMHEDVLDLLKQVIEREGGSVFLMTLDGNSLLGPIVLAALGHLVPSLDVSNPLNLLSGLENTITRSGVINDADAHYLDAEMHEVLTKDSKWYAGEVAKGGIYKWQEEHKMLLSYLADVATTAAYAAVIYASASAQQGNQTRNGACFISGTIINTATGQVPIEQLKSGDYVYSENVETGEIAKKEVIETYIRNSELLVHIWIMGQEIQVTPNHRFYSLGGGWVEAESLVEGDNLKTISGELVSIQAVEYEVLEAPITVYNLQVDDYHTYYVGNYGVLVHNEDCKRFTPEQQELDAMGKGYARKGEISRSDAEAFVDLASKANYRARIDEGHPNRSPSNQQPHLHYGNNSEHIPIRGGK